MSEHPAAQGRLAGKVAFVSGGARGQGRSHAVRMAAEGADIVIFDNPAKLEWLDYPTSTADDLAQTAALVEAQGRRVLADEVDVRDGAALRRLADAAVDRFGSVDIVVANAGIGPRGHHFWEIPDLEWHDMIDINLTGVWRTVSAVVPAMIDAGRGGSIIATSSAAGLRAASNIAAYNVAKVGVIALVQTMARELARHYIRVNAIAPSTVDTPMAMHQGNYRLFRPDLAEPTQDDAVPAFRRLNLIPEPWLEPADISAGVVFLASDESRYITGSTLALDLGGVLK